MRETINRENGAITLFVLLACLFFVFTLAGVYISNLNKLQTQEQQVRQIQENYSKDIGRIDEIYENLSKGIKVNLSQNPSNEIWTKDEVTLTGNAEVKGESSATIDGYTFTTNAEEPSSWGTVNNQVNITETIKITENGEYYFWVKDSKNEISSTKITVANIDKTAPTVGTIIAREESQDGTEYDLTKSLWTNKDVYIEKVDGSDKEAGHKKTTITIQKDGRTVEKWTNIEGPVKLTETGTYTVIVTTEDNAGNTVTSEPYIIKTDKEAPIVTATATTESITITATDEGSGIIGYTVTDSSTQPENFTTVGNTKSLSTKVSNLTQDTLYYVWVIDEAKNINAEKMINTGTVVALTDSNTTFSSTPSGWTNENVTVTVSTTVAGYTIQTSKDAINWDTTNPVIFTENGAMYARLWDGTNAGGYASYNVTNIDKTAPIVIETTATPESIKITSTDEASGIVGYEVTTTSTEPTNFTTVTNTKNLNVTKTSLKEDTKYYVWVKDAAGNISIGKLTNTEKIPTYLDSTLAVAPSLSDGMQPVKYVSGTGWVKVDKTDSSWYDYSQSSKQWANIVLGDATWSNKGNYQVLSESSSYTQLVWIPRFAYKITSKYHYNVTSYSVGGSVDIAFIDTNNKDRNGKTYSTTFPSVTNNAMDDYVVHPAFSFGTTELGGFWVGKFETSSKEGSGGSASQDNVTTKTIQIKAGVNSWRYLIVNNIFTVCVNMNKSGNVYGLNENDNIVDPHMMKNSEWGAAAYLTQSAYGKNSQLYINNSSTHMTGNSGGGTSSSASSGISNAYNTSKGYGASTTGTIYGVYDMAGGTDECMAAYYSGGSTSNGTNLVNADARYKDVYKSSYGSSIISEGHFGDAMYETSYSNENAHSWYCHWSYYFTSSYAFINRGGYYGDAGHAGIYSFYFTSGEYGRRTEAGGK